MRRPKSSSWTQTQPQQRDHPRREIFPISLKQVCAIYPENQHSSLEEIDLTIQKGTHLALVGPSGAGKTTLVYLLLRFLNPACGYITANGYPLQDWNRADWLENIAWVPQTPHLFAGSIAENITFSRLKLDEARLSTAIQSAGLKGWIDSLPGGWNSPVGELASGISTGQAQRIAIARAFYKDAPLLIMDEPTSAVDPLMEASLQELTRTLIQHRTTITIAHRLPTIYQSDAILMMKSGRIMEMGDHASLLQAGGLYAEFFRTYHDAN